MRFWRVNSDGGVVSETSQKGIIAPVILLWSITKMRSCQRGNILHASRGSENKEVHFLQQRNEVTAFVQKWQSQHNMVPSAFEGS